MWASDLTRASKLWTNVPQWAPLIGFMDNGINWLMESKLSHFANPKWPSCMLSSFAYKYQSVIGISFTLSQSIPIKWRPLWFKCKNVVIGISVKDYVNHFLLEPAKFLYSCYILMLQMKVMNIKNWKD